MVVGPRTLWSEDAVVGRNEIRAGTPARRALPERKSIQVSRVRWSEADIADRRGRAALIPGVNGGIGW